MDKTKFRRPEPQDSRARQSTQKGHGSVDLLLKLHRRKAVQGGVRVAVSAYFVTFAVNALHQFRNVSATYPTTKKVALTPFCRTDRAENGLL